MRGRSKLHGTQNVIKMENHYSHPVSKLKTDLYGGLRCNWRGYVGIFRRLKACWGENYVVGDTGRRGFQSNDLLIRESWPVILTLSALNTEIRMIQEGDQMKSSGSLALKAHEYH